jgi:hypothetical protein
MSLWDDIFMRSESTTPEDWIEIMFGSESETIVNIEQKTLDRYITYLLAILCSLLLSHLVEHNLCSPD